MEKLAVFGGTPVFEKKIGYGHQYIDENDIRAVTKVLRSDFLTCGPEIERTEEKLRRITGAKYAVLVSNGTAALHAACYAAGIGDGDEVITTPITFAASANCALYLGGKPVFADIDPETYNIDPDSVEAHITPRTRAVVAVDFTGQAVQLNRIREICAAHSLTLIEDAAHSLGTRYQGKAIGSLADMTTFSFHPVKTCTAGEGGAITTNDDAFYKRLTLFRAHGITRNPDWMERAPEGGWCYEQVALGLNYRMTDMQAVLLGSQLDKLEQFVRRRREIVERYNAAFSDTPGVIVQKEIPESETARHLYLLQLDTARVSCTRKEAYDALQAEGVGCNVHYIPVYWFPYYEKLGYRRELCPNAEKLYERLITIPLYYGMTDSDADGVIYAVKKVLSHYRRE